MKKLTLKRILIISVSTYLLGVLAFLLMVFGPYLFVSNAPLCVAQLYGDYSVQIFLLPVNPAPNQEVELTAIIRSSTGDVPDVSVVMAISKGILPVYTSSPQRSGNGIFIFYYNFTEVGEYLVSFIIVDDRGTTIVDTSVVVSEPIPHENMVIPLIFLPMPAVIIFTTYFVSRQK